MRVRVSLRLDGTRSHVCSCFCYLEAPWSDHVLFWGVLGRLGGVFGHLGGVLECKIYLVLVPYWFYMFSIGFHRFLISTCHHFLIRGVVWSRMVLHGSSWSSYGSCTVPIWFRMVPYGPVYQSYTDTGQSSDPSGLVGSHRAISGSDRFPSET